MYNRKYTPNKIASLQNNEIFVFGSNLDGLHGGGAARVAYQKFGAQWGKGVGMQGKSYGIPTMHGGVDVIKPYIDDFIEFDSRLNIIKNKPAARCIMDTQDLKPLAPPVLQKGEWRNGRLVLE